MKGVCLAGGFLCTQLSRVQTQAPLGQCCLEGAKALTRHLMTRDMWSLSTGLVLTNAMGLVLYSGNLTEAETIKHVETGEGNESWRASSSMGTLKP